MIVDKLGVANTGPEAVERGSGSVRNEETEGTQPKPRSW